MKARAMWSAIVVLASGSAAWAAESGGITPPMQTPVVVELFQSQGCSDCPPAQENLNRLADRPDVLALSYGVTYWDYLGWKDSFASPQFTQRQRDYSARNHDLGVATPQYWINGRQTVLGANPSRVSQLIDQGSPTGGPSLTVVGSNLSIGSGVAPPGGADIWRSTTIRERSRWQSEPERMAVAPFRIAISCSNLFASAVGAVGRRRLRYLPPRASKV